MQICSKTRLIGNSEADMFRLYLFSNLFKMLYEENSEERRWAIQIHSWNFHSCSIILSREYEWRKTLLARALDIELLTEREFEYVVETESELTSSQCTSGVAKYPDCTFQIHMWCTQAEIWRTVLSLLRARFGWTIEEISNCELEKAKKEKTIEHKGS